MTYSEAKQILQKTICPSDQANNKFAQALETARRACDIATNMERYKEYLASKGLTAAEDRVTYFTLCNFLESEEE